MRLRLVLLLAALVLPAVARAQPTAPSDLLRAVREATERLDYGAAEDRSREVLARYADFTPDQLVEVHTTLGVVLHARNEAVEARRQFEAALSLDPSLVLDSVLVSPKTVELFEAVRAERARSAATGLSAPTVRYVVLPDRRPGAALRSAVLPGWGQFSKGDRGRGLAFALGVGSAAAATVGLHVAYRQADDRYDAATAPDDIDRTYREANRLFRSRNALAIATVAGWVAAVAEALVTGAPRPPSAKSARAPTVRVEASVAGAAIGFRLEL